MEAELDGMSQPSDPSQTSSLTLLPRCDFQQGYGIGASWSSSLFGQGHHEDYVTASSSKATSFGNDEQVQKLIREEMSVMEGRMEQWLEQHIEKMSAMEEQMEQRLGQHIEKIIQQQVIP